MRLPSFRLLPATMLVAFLLLGIKLGQIMQGGERMMLGIAGDARAEQAPPAEKPAEGAEAPPAEGAAKPAEKPAEGKEGEHVEGEEGEGGQPIKPEFSQVEVDLLQSLAKRREELEEWSRQVELKENMLMATEQRINEKIDSLKMMKKDIEQLLALYNEQEDTKIRSLVKIYENMKPKDAARIFEELDMPVLLTVVDRMSERKVAPVLAGMTPARAKELTVQLAEQRKLQKPRANAASAAAQNALPEVDAPSAPAPAPPPAAEAPQPQP